MWECRSSTWLGLGLGLGSGLELGSGSGLRLGFRFRGRFSIRVRVRDVRFRVRVRSHQKVLGTDREAAVSKGADPVPHEGLVQATYDLVAVEEDVRLRLAQVLEEEGAAAHAVPSLAAVEGTRL